MKGLVDRLLSSSAAVVLGATALITTMKAGPAEATVAVCNTSVTAEGNASISTPTDVGTICDATVFTVDQTSFPAYWEFNWNDQNPNNIYSSIASGTYTGNLTLYDHSDNALESGAYSGSYPSNAQIDDVSFNPGSEYILGIDATHIVCNPSFCGPVTTDPPVTIRFAATVPEPGTLGLMGGVLGLLGFLRRRRKTRGSTVH